MKRAKLIFCLLSVLLMAGIFAGCSGQKPVDTSEINSEGAEPTESLEQDQQTTEIELDSGPVDEPDVNETKEPMRWLSYMMDIDIVEEDPPGANITPDGRFVHIIMTYLSDEAGYGGFLFEDLREISLTLTDSSGNVYEHLGVYNPVTFEEVEEGLPPIAEIQPSSGIFFDIPLNIQLNDLSLNILE